MDYKPGRELDALVAEKVMGWTKEPCIRYGMWKAEQTEHPGFRWTAPGESIKESYIKDRSYPAPYSTDIAAAWQVVDKLQTTLGVWINIDMPGYHPPGVEITFPTEDLEGLLPNKKFYQGGADVPHAICLAALRAVGVKV